MELGKTYFHTHPKMEHHLNIPEDHVLIDREDYNEVLEIMKLLGFNRRAINKVLEHNKK